MADVIFTSLAAIVLSGILFFIGIAMARRTRTHVTLLLTGVMLSVLSIPMSVFLIHTVIEWKGLVLKG